MADFVARYVRTVARTGEDDNVTPERLKAESDELRQELTDLLAREITVPDAAGHVEVSLDLGGRLKGLHLSPYAMRDLDARGLGEAVTAAIKAARGQAGEQLAGELGDAPADLGGQDPQEFLRKMFG